MFWSEVRVRVRNVGGVMGCNRRMVLENVGGGGREM